MITSLKNSWNKFCNSTITDLFLFVFTQLILHCQIILFYDTIRANIILKIVVSMNYLTQNIFLPILVNILSPVLLFLIARIVMENNTILKYISKVYQSVKEGLEINNEEVVDAEDVSDSQLNGSTSTLNLVSPSNYGKILKKESKDYGPDDKSGWEVRTFYLISKQQLYTYDLINFKVKDNKFSLYLRTSDLINCFDLDNEQESVSDGANKIRIYIFQKTNDENKKEYFLVRFGRKALKNPIQLVES